MNYIEEESYYTKLQYIYNSGNDKQNKTKKSSYVVVVVVFVIVIVVFRDI